MTIRYFGRRDDAGQLVGLFRGTLDEKQMVAKGEILRPEGWMLYPELLRYLYVTGDVTPQDQVEPTEARLFIDRVAAPYAPDEADLGAA